MKILFACEYFVPFAPGGAEVSNLLLARALVREGHGVTVVTPNYGARPVETLDGVLVRRFPFWARARSGQHQVDALWTTNPVFYLVFAWYLLVAAKRERPAVIHAHHPNALPPAAAVARLMGLPLVYTVRDTSLLCPIGGGCLLSHSRVPSDCSLHKLVRHCVRAYYPLYAPESRRRMVRRALLPLHWADVWIKNRLLSHAQVVGVSEGILNVYRQAGRTWADDGVVAYAIPPEPPPDALGGLHEQRERWGIGGDEQVVLYAGKLSYGKGIGVLLRAAETVLSIVPTATFLLAGKGRLNGASLPPRVRVLGSLPQSELFRLYAMADVVVVPSIWPEPLSRVLLESAAFGKPCVATDVGGTREVVAHGETGLLVPRDEPEALAAAIVALLRDETSRQGMGREARVRLGERFSEEKTVSALLRIYAMSQRQNESCSW
jgi:glycosyltransferase involved in cell wall biosynthesis